MLRLPPLQGINTALFPRTLPRASRLWAIRSLSTKNPNSEENSKEVSRKEDLGVSKIRSETSKSAPSPLGPESGIEAFLKKDTKPYIPKNKYERLTYDYKNMPNEDDFGKHSEKGKKPKTVSRWTGQLPKILTIAALIWAGYTVKVWFYPPEEHSDSKELLDPYSFHKFVVTHKQQIDSDHFLIEVKPKFRNWQYSYYAHYDEKSIWSGEKIWSVEVKQPDIMVTRSYTPLPLYFMKSEHTRSGEREPLLRVIDNDVEDYDKGGVMTFYIKRYDNGEVSRYLCNRKIGDEIELRGPHIDYKFPYHPLKAVHTRPSFRDLPSKVEPESLVATIKKRSNIPDFDNLDFYCAGTGVAPALQVLLSRNPYRGFVRLHYSAQSTTEIAPLERFLFFLEKLDRLEVIKHIDTEGGRIKPKHIPKPEERSYVSSMRLEQENSDAPADALKLRMAIMDESSLTSQIEEVDDVARATRYSNALEQARETLRVPKKASALALVCGPDGYVDSIAGPKDRAADEQGEVGGMLGQKGWNSTNVYKF